MEGMVTEEVNCRKIENLGTSRTLVELELLNANKDEREMGLSASTLESSRQSLVCFWQSLLDGVLYASYPPQFLSPVLVYVCSCKR